MISGGDLMQAALLVLRAAVCAFLAFAGAYWIITSWIDRRLSAVEAVGLLSALLVVMVFLVAYTVQSSLLVLVLLVLVVGLLVFAISLYAKAADRRLNRRFDDEDAAKYLAALDLDPKNVAAHSLLADLYRRQGRLEEALAEYQEAVRLSPELQEERVWVGRIRTMLDRKEQGLPLHESGKTGDFACYSCGAIIPAEETHCPECGQFVGKG